MQPATAQPAGGGWAARDRVIGDWAGTDWPTGEQLATTKPPKGPRTEPQPALPDTSVQASVQSSAQATRYQPAVQATSTQAAVQPNGVQPTACRRRCSRRSSDGWGTTAAQPTAGQPAGGQPGGGAGADGTQVLFLGGDAWQVPGGPDGAGQANPYGYQEAQRRRRMWLIGGIGAGTAVAVAIIVVVASSMGGSSGATAADQTRVTTPPSPTAAAPSRAGVADRGRVADRLGDAARLGAVRRAVGPVLHASSPLPGGGLPERAWPARSRWTAGEAAVAGQINGGQTTWYGEACSGPLPAQYNYTGASDLENTATNVASTLGNAYYTALAHTSSPVLSQPVSVSGHPGWEIEYQLTYTNAAAQGATWTTEEGAVVVVDTGAGNTPVVFFASVPNTLGATTVNSLVSSLQLNVVPNPSGSPDAGGSPRRAARRARQAATSNRASRASSTSGARFTLGGDAGGSSWLIRIARRQSKKSLSACSTIACCGRSSSRS